MASTMAECKFYRALTPTTGECRRLTPTEPTPNGQTTGWPIVRPNDPACSAFEPAAGRVAAVTGVTVGPAPVTVAEGDPTRRTLILANNSGAVVYVKYGPGASPSLWTHRLGPNSSCTISCTEWYGLVSAARGSGTSTLLVTTVR